jgi:hypothetical protein
MSPSWALRNLFSTNLVGAWVRSSDSRIP